VGEDGSDNQYSKRWRLDQIALLLAGVLSFALGATVHEDRSNLAIVLVGLGGLLIVVATLLPRLQSLSGKVAGSSSPLPWPLRRLFCRTRGSQRLVDRPAGQSIYVTQVCHRAGSRASPRP
jgi:hypothetical protein